MCFNTVHSLGSPESEADVYEIDKNEFNFILKK